MSRAEDARLRRRMDGLFRSVQPPPAPVDVIIRRGQRIRQRRTGAAAGCLSLAGIVAATALVAVRGGGQGSPQIAASAPASAAGPGGVFATGKVNGHPWRLAVQDIADPGQRCLAGITINGTDADPVTPNPDSSGSVTLGSVDPGFSFGFIQVPAQVGTLVIDGGSVREVIAAACGYRYRLVGFSYPLNGAVQITAVEPGAPTSASFPVPVPVVSGVPSGSFPQDVGIWDNVGALAPAASATVASGTVSGDRWSIRLRFGIGGNCWTGSLGSAQVGSAQLGTCAPIGTPGGAETITALPLSLSDGSGATGYAVELSPATARLQATLSNGTSELAYPAIVAGRKYAAFMVADSVRLTRLAWLAGNGEALGSTTAIPREGYVQFRP